ncbi:Pentatricopeptide repeat-containing protein At5g04780, mitochondrial [Linum grandiflorum]
MIIVTRLCRRTSINGDIIKFCRKHLSTAARPAMPDTSSGYEFVWTDTGRCASQIAKVHALLQSCAKKKNPSGGKACHGRILQLGYESDTLTSNMLMNMYWKCGSVVTAHKVFDRMSEKSLVSFNTIISAYTRTGDEGNALLLFVQMRREGNNPMSEFTVSSVLCACASKSDVLASRQLHCFAVKASMDDNVFVGTALLDVYSKSGFVHDASRVFDGMSEKSDVTWSSMAAGLVQNKLYEEALVLFTRARRIVGLENDKFMISSVVSACAGLAALIQGTQVHSIICKTGFGSNTFVASSLVDMYAKCGTVKEAFRLFQDMEDNNKNVVLWNVIISAFAKHSRSLEVMVLFEKMQQAGTDPDEVTYISVLSACSHMGLVNESRTYFRLMTEHHNLSANVLHYSCMVDVLSRAGVVHEANELMKNMPFKATASMWGSVLASCRARGGNVELAEVAARNLFEMEPGNAANYVMLSNAYAAGNQWEDVSRTRKLIKENEVKKERGKSWLEIKDKVHTFMAGERNHPSIRSIYVELDRVMEEAKERGGYKVETCYDFHDVDDSKKVEQLKHHSEKLAVTFGLMSLPVGIPIRIMKNLRICGDCHSFMKSVSSVSGREIIVRDTNRFHHFLNGHCSCNDFW